MQWGKAHSSFLREEQLLTVTQALINGLAQGLIFAVVGVAFALVYVTTKTFYIALGAIYTLSPYLLLAAIQHGLPSPLGFIFVVLIAALISVLCEETIHWRLERKRAPTDVHLIASLGASLVLVQTVVLIWGSDAQVLRVGVDTIYQFAGVRISRGQLIGSILATATLLLTFALLRRAEIGLQLRGLASNSLLLSVLGGDVRWLRRVVFALSGGLAAIAACATALDVGFDPNVGLRAVLVGAAATIVGGRGSFVATAIAGILFGILRAQVVWFVSARWEDAVTFAILAICLFLLPGGLNSFLKGKARLEEQT